MINTTGTKLDAYLINNLLPDNVLRNASLCSLKKYVGYLFVYSNVCKRQSLCMSGYLIINFYVITNGFAAPGSSVLDPHFMITNPKTGERFCFDYGGKERDVLNLANDEKTG